MSLDVLARQLGLSKGSVSRILNGKGKAFSEETRTRVHAAADAVGYRPNVLARALASGATGIISICFSEGATPFVSKLAEAYGDRALALGWDPSIQLRLAPRRKGGLDPSLALADGAIFHDYCSIRWSPDLLETNFPGRGVPPVVFAGACGWLDGADNVRIDLSAPALAAARWVVAQGCRRVVHLTTTSDANTTDPRRIAYLAVMAEAGLVPTVVGNLPLSRSAARSVIREWLEVHGVPDAFFCHNDEIALAAYRASIDRGLQVPDDVLLVGCDGAAEMDLLPVPIPTIVQPIPIAVGTAVDFLSRRLSDPSAPVQSAFLSADFVVPRRFPGATGT
ncbi:MAG: LacI family DNA-binding transcriptional regulator [Armatimonadota bacterium]